MKVAFVAVDAMLARKNDRSGSRGASPYCHAPVYGHVVVDKKCEFLPGLGVMGAY